MRYPVQYVLDAAASVASSATFWGFYCGQYLPAVPTRNSQLIWCRRWTPWGTPAKLHERQWQTFRVESQEVV